MVRTKNRKSFDLNQGDTLDSFYPNSKSKSRTMNIASDKDVSLTHIKKKAKQQCEKKEEKDSFNENRFKAVMPSASVTGPKPPKRYFGQDFCVAGGEKKIISFMEENEKDEDTDEFFQLIQDTVEVAVKKSMKDFMDKQLKNMNSKISEVSEAIRATEAKFEKIKSELSSKISHYGEETSRHFRYLCMKSEYDKMFYQHQSMVAMANESRPNLFAAAPAPVPKESAYFQPWPQPSTAQANPTETERTVKPPEVTSTPAKCTCRASSEPADNVGKSSKSELALRELLEQIQMYYPELCRNDKNGKGGDSPRTRLDIGDDDSMVDGDDDESTCQGYLTYPSPVDKK